MQADKVMVKGDKAVQQAMSLQPLTCSSQQKTTLSNDNDLLAKPQHERI